MDRGQVFSLDLVLALALLVLSIGIIFQQTELFLYNQKDLEESRSLEIIGESASNMLVFSPEIVCELVSGGSVVDYLNNCIPDDCSTVSGPALGLSSDYSYNVSGAVSCGTPFNASLIEGPVYSVDRTVVLSSGKEVTRKEFNECNAEMSPNCVFGSPASAPKKITLTIWRNSA